MKKIITAILCIALTNCDNPKTDVAKPNPSTLVDNTGVKTPSDKTTYATAFSTNVTSGISKSINGIFQDHSGHYWFASNDEGVFSYDGTTLIQFTIKDGLCDNQVLSIQEDRSNNLWFLTTGGISRFDGKSFKTFPDKGNNHLLADKGLKMELNDLWFEAGGGAYRYNGNSFSYLLLPKSNLDAKYSNTTNPKKPDARKLNPYSVYCSLKDKNGNLWLGTQTMGVCRYDGKKCTWLTEKGLSGPAVRALFEDQNGQFWFGNNGNGLFRYDGQNVINFTAEKGLGNPEFTKTGKSRQGTLARVWSITDDNLGNIWIGTYDSGVWCYDGINLINYTIKDGLPSNTITTIYKDKQGVLWFGTDVAGVFTYNGTSFSVFAPAQTR